MSLHTFTHTHSHTQYKHTHTLRFFVHIHEKLLAFIVVVAAATGVFCCTRDQLGDDCRAVPASVLDSALAPVSLATKKYVTIASASASASTVAAAAATAPNRTNTRERFE